MPRSDLVQASEARERGSRIDGMIADLSNVSLDLLDGRLVKWIQRSLWVIGRTFFVIVTPVKVVSRAVLP